MRSAPTTCRRRLRMPLALVAVAAGAMAIPSVAAGQVAAADEFVPGQVIVTYDADSTATERRRARVAADAELEQTLSSGDAQMVSGDGSVPGLIRRLERQGAVADAQPNYVYSGQAADAGNNFGSLWGLRNVEYPGADVNAQAAWNLTRGSGQTIAIVDTGVDRFNPDLAGRMWVNHAERDGQPGVDDDDNGMIDDVDGADFIERDVDPDDYQGHGTHVAGTAGASETNRAGTVGVAPESKLMAVRVLDAQNLGTTATVSQGIRYAARSGASVINLSLAGDSSSGDSVLSQAVDDAAAEDAVVVVAAGNSARDVDSKPTVPCTLPQANLVCVGAVNRSGSMWSSSNFGVRSVDVAAPGDGIYSTPLGFASVPWANRSFDAGLDGWEALEWGSDTSWSVGEDTGYGSAAAGIDASGPRGLTMASLRKRDAFDLTNRYGCRVEFNVRVRGLSRSSSFQYGASGGAAELSVAHTQAEGAGAAYLPSRFFLSRQATGWISSNATMDGRAEVRPWFYFESEGGPTSDGVRIDDPQLTCRTDRTSAASTQPVRMSGTSMAAPHVAGVAALARAADPDASAVETAQTLRSTARKRGPLTGRVATAAIVDAGAAVYRAAGVPGPGGAGTTPPTSPPVTPPAAPGPVTSSPAPVPRQAQGNAGGQAQAPAGPAARRGCRGLRAKKLRACKLRRAIASCRKAKRAGRARRLCIKRAKALSRCSAKPARTRGQRRAKQRCVRAAKRIDRTIEVDARLR